MLPVGNETEILPVAADVYCVLTMGDEKWPEYIFLVEGDGVITLKIQ